MIEAIVVVIIIVLIYDCAVSRAFMRTLTTSTKNAKYFCDKEIK